MKNIFYYPLLLLFISLICCSDEKIQSKWSDDTISIDGNGMDWKDIPLTYNEDMKLIYGFINNDSSLSFMMRFRDQGLARMLSRRGMTLWFNENNDKVKVIGIHYVDESVQNMLPRMRGNHLPTDQRTDNKQPAFIPAGIFTLAQKDSIEDGAEINSIPGLEAAAGHENGFYCFEFRILLNEHEKTNRSLQVSKNGKIKACLEIGAMSEEDKERMQEMMAQRSGNGGRGGGMKGGGGRGGMGGNKGGSRMQAPDTDGEEIWMTVTLANKNK